MRVREAPLPGASRVDRTNEKPDEACMAWSTLVAWFRRTLRDLTRLSQQTETAMDAFTVPHLWEEEVEVVKRDGYLVGILGSSPHSFRHAYACI
ncbi:unnamed protein product [Protopolystoma xenopodis]|uniref:Uncharacterized protein n=1 Tax=Protopolystoma xenopodis TaxID=117903 RepID=A0A3S5B2A1_9PLAT|nr:unnamed protein product [Protopolystoma xenopodis]